MSTSKIYEFLLSKLELTTQHEDNLLSRGLSKSDILAGGYKSWPYKRIHLTQACMAEFGEASLLGVPGFWKNDQGKVVLSGVTGIAIPILGLDGKLQGIKLRPDKPANPTSKYVHLSSNPAPDKKTGEVKYPNGTAAKVSCHFPHKGEGHPATEGQEIRVTEGELKADVATRLSDIYTISVPGVGLWEECLPHLEKLKPSKVIISYDSDKNKQISSYSDKPFEVGVATADFYYSLKAQGFNVVIEDWDEKIGKGIDDVLADGRYGEVKILTDEEAQEFCKKVGGDAGAVESEWVYVIGIERFINTRTNQELKKDQFKDKFLCKSKKKCPVDKALKSASFPKIDFPTYWPNKERILTREDGTTEYNYWRKSDIQPCAGDVTPFLQHAEYILPDEAERGHLLDYLAYQVQFPGEKVHWAVLLQGTQGTGKSYFGDVMIRVLGKDNVSQPTNDDIHEPYTGWQKNCQFIIVEELMARGRLELMNKLKPKITQPTVTIREMYKAAYEVANRYNFLMLTNHEDAIIIDDKDRRYCVLFSPAIPKDHSYYHELWKWTEAHSGRILQYFMERDLSAFLPKAHAPFTEAKKKLIRLSSTPLKAWVQDGIESGAWPFMTDVLTTHHLAACVPNYIRGATPATLGRAIAECGGKQLPQVHLTTGERVRPWSLRRHEIWGETGLEKETIINEIERWKASKEPGGNPLLDAEQM